VRVRSRMDARLAVRLPRRSGRSDVVRASTLPRRPDQGPDPAARASVPSGRGTGGLHDVRRPARFRPVRDPGTTASSLPDTGRTCGPPRRRIRPAGPTAPRRSLPPWRVRALRGAVGGGSRRDAYCGEVGRRQEVHRRGRARKCACRVRKCSEPSRGRGHPGKESDRSRRARGGAGDGVQRLGAVVALWSAGRPWRPAGWRPGRTPGPVGGRVPPRPGQSRRRREGPCRPAGGPRGPLWPAGGLRRPC
jgi:hypothetical protein